MTVQVSVTFSAAGVTVTVPPQATQVTEIRIVQLAMLPLKSMKASPEGFQPSRRVINIEVERTDAPGSYISEFDPPMRLEVRHTAADRQAAQDFGLPLSLGFWDGTKWVRFTDKHHFELGPDPTNPSGGLASVLISRWEDPTVAWGR